MTRRLGYLSFVLAAASLVGAVALGRLGPIGPSIDGASASLVAEKALLAAAVVLTIYGVYRIVLGAIRRSSDSKRKLHTIQNVLRLVLGVVGLVGVLAVLTEQWLGFLFSLGVLGFAITFALQQPLLSLMGWIYIVIKQPYGVGDRIRIEDARGDVIDVDFLVTTLWEINGELVTTNQPSGRVVTFPNSVVLSKEIYNYSWEQFPYIWNELSIQVAYETDLEFAEGTMRRVADDYLGDEMEHNVERYREVLEATPVELEVRDRPAVNIRQGESWIDLRLRYLIHPRRGTQVRNELYERILAEFNAAPDRVKFPVGRNR